MTAGTHQAAGSGFLKVCKLRDGLHAAAIRGAERKSKESVGTGVGTIVVVAGQRNRRVICNRQYVYF